MVNSKSKGSRGEREFAKKLAEKFNVTAFRGRQYKGGPNSPDVISNINGIHWEVKRCQYLNIYKALEQAKAEAKEDEIGVVVWRKNRENWLIVFEFDRLDKVVEIFQRLRESK